MSTIRCPIANHQLCPVGFFLVSSKGLIDGCYCFVLCDIALKSDHSFDRSDLLKVNCHNSDVLEVVLSRGGFFRRTVASGETLLLQTFFFESSGDELRPTARSCTDVDNSLHSFEQIVEFVQMHQFVG